jgi:putative oxidoreductase
LLYALIFVVAGFGHFTHQEIAYAAAQGIPLASVLAPVSGIMAIVGGLSILLDFHGKLGAWLLVLFLVPVTLTMHNFWAVKDPMMQQVQMAMFLKNISMLGSALFFTPVTTGSLSLDSRGGPVR